MSKWLLFLLLTTVTGRPLLSLGLMLVAWFVLDRFTLGILPDPLRLVIRARRAASLARVLDNNPHDRRARVERAEILLGFRRPGAAVALLRPNLEAGDDDPTTLYLMGTACYGAGHAREAEVFLGAAEEHEPGFRQGAAELELGRGRLVAGDAAGAVEALQRFVTLRTSTVEGRVLLARALDRHGEHAAARRMREEAWSEYVAAPRFQRRRERWWAWRLRPWRPLGFALAGGTAAAVALRAIAPAVLR